jgi:hypothetical protein
MANDLCSSAIVGAVIKKEKISIAKIEKTSCLILHSFY